MGTISNFTCISYLWHGSCCGPVIGAPITMIIGYRADWIYVYGLSSLVGLAVAIGFILDMEPLTLIYSC